MRKICMLLYSLMALNVFGQEINRVEPPHWWVGMKNPELQLMIYGTDISKTEISIEKAGVTLIKSEKTDNPNYVFVNLNIDTNAQPGNLKLNFTTKHSQFSYDYELKERRNNAATKPKIQGNDAIYLITPDRFANGNPDNDNIKAYLEKANRTKIYGRHGGDLKGITDNLDYIQNLGMTTLWLNPIDQNNQPEFSYHGYAPTDFYKIDERYGSNAEFKALASELHKRGMKLFKDQIFNHCGSYHWWIKDLPAKNWINDQSIGRSIFQNPTVSDPHVSDYDITRHYKGYFDTNMPDLNFENKHLATYMIQNSIWWIEYANLDGLRIDTYPYPDRYFLADWKKQLDSEYPGIFVVAEIWVQDVAHAAFWNPPCDYEKGYFPGTNSVTDFPVYYAMLEGFRKNGDVWKTYQTLGKDFLYGAPENNVIFFDNHDIARSFAELDYDMNQFKLATTFMFTTRGILQWYYGSEIAMQEHENHGVIRQDMPGGWKNDKSNVFSETNLTNQQSEALNHVSRMLNWRKNSEAIKSGKLVHFIPENNCYVYFRIAKEETLMIILNNGNNQENFDLSKYQEILKDFETATNVIDNQKIDLTKNLNIEGKTPYVFILK